MTAFKVYLLFVLFPNLGLVFYIAAICSCWFFVRSLCIFVGDREDYEDDKCNLKKQKTIMIFLGSLFAISLFLCVAIPSKKDMVVMYIAPKIINNQDIQEIPGYVLKYIEKEVGR